MTVKQPRLVCAYIAFVLIAACISKQASVLCRHFNSSLQPEREFEATVLLSCLAALSQIRENQFHKTSHNMAKTTSSNDSWRDELLKDVKTIPKVGVPGIIEVLGDQAEPMLLDDRGRAIMAAATYGSGKIVAFSHNGYIKQFREGKNKKFENLNRNIRTWLGMKEGGDVTFGDSLKNVADIPKSGVLVIAGGGDRLKKFVPGILEFVQGGGGFLCGVCPWGWLEKRPNATIDGMALQQIVKEAGMSFTGDTCEVQKGFSAAKCKDDVEKAPVSVKKQAADVANTTPESCAKKRAEKPAETCSSQSMAKATSPSGSWKDELLKDVTTVPKVGVPGNIVVFGDQAEPILLDDRGRAIMAAATYGSGKIVAFSHNGYIKQFREGKNKKFEDLNRNIRTWLGMKEGDDVTDASNIKEAAEIPKSGVLLVAGGGDKGKKLIPDVLKFVREGGGLLCGVCPWGWLQKRPRKTIDDMVLQGILNEVGLSFTAETCAAKKEISAAESKEKAEISHLGRALKAIDLDPDSVEKYAETVTENAHSIPDKCFEKRLNAPMEKCYEKCIKKHKDCIPKGGKKRVKDSRGRAVVSLTTGFLEKQAKMGKEVKAPGINDFPGDFEEEPQLQCASVIIKSARKERHSTGYYLPAGKVLTIKATTTGEHLDDWRVRVGAHSDNLSGKKKFKRWPKLSVVKRLEAETKISSPYGGLIYFESPKEAGDLTASMENVVEAPFYDLEDPRSVQNWSERRKAPGLWADLAGEHIIFTLPAASVRDLEDPSEGLRAWDDVVKAHHELRGTNPSGEHRQRIVPDRQPKAGWMHAGYPIVTNMDIAARDKFILDGKKIRKAGNWGLFHELGHNMQRKWWTFEGTGEVTCNVFTLHAMDVVAKRDPWRHPWVRNKWPAIEQFFKDGAQHDVWKKKAGIALAVYAQLAHHFGWEPYKKVFRQYEKDPKKKQPENNKERIVLWIVRFSEEVGRNLVPLFDFWGFPHIEEAQAQVSGLEAFLPDDDLTALAPERLAEIRGKYNIQT
ncbi:TRPM8 channel-associated factor 2-like [Branchiostoma floridae]|uniref:TRPM8 channel-associated factor 2-like n=1 Tax=Branchiostoma floridae TaxID=7739 RepID=A0A9J7MAY6_BRAFL|nr:TRPM8 channel-associated factor 2-like [Branchiostoma floridae]